MCCMSDMQHTATACCPYITYAVRPLIKGMSMSMAVDVRNICLCMTYVTYIYICGCVLYAGELEATSALFSTPLGSTTCSTHHWPLRSTHDWHIHDLCRSLGTSLTHHWPLPPNQNVTDQFDTFLTHHWPLPRYLFPCAHTTYPSLSPPPLPHHDTHIYIYIYIYI